MIAFDDAKKYANSKHDSSVLIVKVGWEHLFPDSPNLNLMPVQEDSCENLGFVSDIFKHHPTVKNLYGGLHYFGNEPQKMTRGEFKKQLPTMMEEFLSKLKEAEPKDVINVKETETAMGTIFTIRGGTHQDVRIFHILQMVFCFLILLSNIRDTFAGCS